MIAAVQGLLYLATCGIRGRSGYKIIISGNTLYSPGGGLIHTHKYLSSLTSRLFFSFSPTPTPRLAFAPTSSSLTLHHPIYWTPRFSSHEPIEVATTIMTVIGPIVGGIVGVLKS